MERCVTGSSFLACVAPIFWTAAVHRTHGQLVWWLAPIVMAAVAPKVERIFRNERH